MMSLVQTHVQRNYKKERIKHLNICCLLMCGLKFTERLHHNICFQEGGFHVYVMECIV